jgi:hypothetical protein
MYTVIIVGMIVGTVAGTVAAGAGAGAGAAAGGNATLSGQPKTNDKNKNGEADAEEGESLWSPSLINNTNKKDI